MIDSMIKKLVITWPNLALFSLAIELEGLLKDCDSVLDLGCGSSSPLRLVERKKLLVGVDGHSESLKKSKAKKIHDSYFKMDVLSVGSKFKKNSFDAVIALDLIEHLKKKDGFRLLAMMEKIAAKRVVVLTPNGFIPQHNEANDLQEHLSGWSVKDFRSRGYVVLGKYGWKTLRGEEAELKYRPKAFWGLLSELTHFLYTKKNPEYAFSLLCYKEIKK